MEKNRKVNILIYCLVYLVIGISFFGYWYFIKAYTIIDLSPNTILFPIMIGGILGQIICSFIQLFRYDRKNISIKRIVKAIVAPEEGLKDQILIALLFCFIMLLPAVLTSLA